ncbi:MAG: aminopeptidase N [Gammaproteobacteria bacterium]
MSQTQKPETVRLADYSPPPFLIDTVELEFELDPLRTLVRSRLSVRRNPACLDETETLRLDGVGLKLEHVALDGEALSPEAYELGPESLELKSVPDRFELLTLSVLSPSTNTSLEGLYLSGDIYCTQCEAEGFRKITWFADRPDVMARYTVKITADRRRCPVLLSNGNAIERGELENGRHFVKWEDPFAKPSYLFALVAGDLACVQDTYTTGSGREVSLRIYVEQHNVDRCDHAMASLVKAMRWDERTFGLEYDLDIYMIVAVDDFNMGAMENKGLNIFNSKCVLARPDTATDADYAGIEGVVAHEYFHNWTGNRVTCRDWFQLSLKEGLTVFRDQAFSAEVTEPAVKRIQDVRMLRTHQFPEDAGPMAHPVRPSAYVEINNFYTVTVYNKGAEVIRMMHTLLGAATFKRGIEIYFERHDGQAVTIEDFVCAMEAASSESAQPVDLGQFRLWYSQAGTPKVEVRTHYDAHARRLDLDCRQSCPPTPGQPDKQALHIPLRVALLDNDGEPMALRLAPVMSAQDARAGAGLRQAHGAEDAVLELRANHERFTFEDIGEKPLVSLARGFSAPIMLEADRSDGELAFLIAHDDDPFSRWDAAQEYATRLMLASLEAGTDSGSTDAGRSPAAFLEALGRMLDDAGAEAGVVAELLSLPAESYLAERVSTVDPQSIHDARHALQVRIARTLEPRLLATYRGMATNEPYRFDAASAGRRSLRNVCLRLLSTLADEASITLCAGQFDAADNMTDKLAALGALAQIDCEQRVHALNAFESQWIDDPLVMDKWFMLQATSTLPGTLETVRSLLSHPTFDRRNPNRVRSLIGAYVHGNPLRFHSGDGAGYRFLIEQIVDLDRLNPQVAARLAGAFSRWRRFDRPRRDQMREALESLMSTPRLSRDCYEIASKSLA